MRTDQILTVNCGSSSVRLALFSARARLWAAHVSGVGAEQALLVAGETGASVQSQYVRAPDHDAALAIAFDASAQALEGAPVAIGHRVVHGGREFTGPAAATAEIEARLVALTPLAPLHQPLNMAGLVAARRHWPQALQVCCFDTAFHAGLPAEAAMMALPRSMFDAGVRRYGFHGLSFASIMNALARDGVDIANERIVIAHLGAGASMAAILAGRSIDTSMGFSTLSGLTMATRPGDVDSGALFYLLRSGMSVEDVEETLYRRSGLLGLSQISGDMAVLLASHDNRAREAVAQFCHQARRWLGGLGAILGGLDRLVFTGGVGEHAPLVRARICEGLDFMGVRLDSAANAANAPLISASSARLVVEVRAADEEDVIQRQTRQVMNAGG